MSFLVIGMANGFKMVMLVLCVVCVTCLVIPTFAAQEKCCEYSWSQQYGHERAEFSVADCKGFVILPDKDKRSTEMPWVWYAPTFIQAVLAKSTVGYASVCWIRA